MIRILTNAFSMYYSAYRASLLVGHGYDLVVRARFGACEVVSGGYLAGGELKPCTHRPISITCPLNQTG